MGAALSGDRPTLILCLHKPKTPVLGPQERGFY